MKARPIAIEIKAVLAEAERLDPEAFAAIDTPRHCATSARRIAAINLAHALLTRPKSAQAPGGKRKSQAIAKR